MKEVTVIELSEQTGLTRSKIYYLIRKGNITISNGKINFKDAIQVINTLAIKKTKATNDESFRHILNILHLQNLALQKQLDLAHEREKAFLSELTNYRQSLLQKTAPKPPKDEDNPKTWLEDNVANTNENSRELMQSESPKNHTTLESCQNINRETETKSTNETYPQSPRTEFIQNETTLHESESETTGQKKEITQQNIDALIDTPSSTHKPSKPPFHTRVKRNRQTFYASPNCLKPK